MRRYIVFLLTLVISLSRGEENVLKCPLVQTSSNRIVDDNDDLVDDFSVEPEKSCTDNETAFKDSQVTSDVIADPPEKFLEVEFTKSRAEVKLGNELTPTDVKEIPDITYEADDDSFYTLILTDPDAPSRKNPVRREWHHWLVVNIPGSDINSGQILTEYVGSAPPKGSGLHRYVFLLFKQPKKSAFDEPTHSKTDGNRGNFSTEKFRKKYNLGKPIAGNFFQAQYDDSVPATHRQLGF